MTDLQRFQYIGQNFLVTGGLWNPATGEESVQIENESGELASFGTVEWIGGMLNVDITHQLRELDIDIEHGYRDGNEYFGINNGGVLYIKTDMEAGMLSQVTIESREEGGEIWVLVPNKATRILELVDQRSDDEILN